jgi:hypothetical protein
MKRNIVPARNTTDEVVDGIIVDQTPLRVLYYIFKVFDFILFITFLIITRWLLKEGFIPMFGLLVFLVRFLWHGIDARVCKSLSIERKRKG